MRATRKGELFPTSLPRDGAHVSGLFFSTSSSLFVIRSLSIGNHRRRRAFVVRASPCLPDHPLASCVRPFPSPLSGTLQFVCELRQIKAGSFVVSSLIYLQCLVPLVFCVCPSVLCVEDVCGCVRRVGNLPACTLYSGPFSLCGYPGCFFPTRIDGYYTS